MSTSRINAEGKTVIPPEILEFLNLNPGDQVVYLIKDGQVVLQPGTGAAQVLPPKLQAIQQKLQDGEKVKFSELQGVLHRSGTKTISIKDMDEAVRNYVANENL